MLPLPSTEGPQPSGAHFPFGIQFVPGRGAQGEGCRQEVSPGRGCRWQEAMLWSEGGGYPQEGWISRMGTQGGTGGGRGAVQSRGQSGIWEEKDAGTSRAIRGTRCWPVRVRTLYSPPRGVSAAVGNCGPARSNTGLPGPLPFTSSEKPLSPASSPSLGPASVPRISQAPFVAGLSVATPLTGWTAVCRAALLLLILRGTPWCTLARPQGASDVHGRGSRRREMGRQKDTTQQGSTFLPEAQCGN